MANLQVMSLCSCKFSYSSSNNQKRLVIMATNNIPKFQKTHLSLPNLAKGGSMEELVLKNDFNSNKISLKTEINESDQMVIGKLYAIKETVADRVEMHKNICEQRKNWNSLLLTSINTIILGAATMAGIAATINANGAPLVALKIASTLLYIGATGMVIIMNKIQPSQLAEEQRNATRLFRHIQKHVQTVIDIGSPTTSDVEDTMNRVLALDKAYPLPLLGVMIDKFPSAVKSAVWWPLRRRIDEDNEESEIDSSDEKRFGNGWNKELENEMSEVVGILRRNDEADYLRLGGIALKLNKVLAVCGPCLTILGAIGSGFVGFGSWAVLLGVVGGALASVVNTMEHGGQVGMVVELYRSNAGFFKEIEEEIEFNLKEKDVRKRENGELFEMKIALQLGRSIAELRHIADKGHDLKEFGSKLF